VSTYKNWAWILGTLNKKAFLAERRYAVLNTSLSGFSDRFLKPGDISGSMFMARQPTDGVSTVAGFAG
jgi:hypothetical protein